jgi:hypothetical protein
MSYEIGAVLMHINGESWKFRAMGADRCVP